MSSQVKRKAKEADEMIRQLAAQEQQNSDSEAPAGDGDDAQPSAEVVAMQPEGEQAPIDDGESALPEASPAPTYSDDDIAELKEEARKADARWRSLQGQIDSKDRQIDQLHQLLARLESAPQQQTPEAPQPVSGYTKEDAEAFGDDMIDLIERIARHVVNQTVDQKVAPLQQEIQSVSTVTASTVQESFESKLTKLVPTWAELNSDQDFITWLQESPTRWEGFQSAAQKRDAAGTADHFLMYIKLKGLDAPKKSERKQQQLEQQIAPGRARSSAPPAASTPDEEKIWTRTEIGTFYKTGKKDYTPEEFAKIERDIARAMKDERVDYSK